GEVPGQAVEEEARLGDLAADERRGDLQAGRLAEGLVHLHAQLVELGVDDLLHGGRGRLGEDRAVLHALQGQPPTPLRPAPPRGPLTAPLVVERVVLHGHARCSVVRDSLLAPSAPRSASTARAQGERGPAWAGGAGLAPPPGGSWSVRWASGPAS